MTVPEDLDRAREIDAELLDHLERSVASLQAEGYSEAEARREAMRRFGTVAKWRTRLLRVHAPRAGLRRWLAASMSYTGALRDLRHAGRTLVRSPLFSLSVLGLFVLAIGAFTIALALINGVLISDPPYANPSQLVYVWGRNDGIRAGFRNLPVSEPDLADWRSAVGALASVGGAVPEDATLTDVADPERLAGVGVIGGFFETLGVAPALGRTLSAGDTAAGERPIVLGHVLWQRRFGGDPGIVGRVMQLDGRPHRVVGVMPAGFMFPRVEEISSNYGFGPELSFYRPWRTGAAGPPTRGNRYAVAIARLRPDASVEIAAQQIENAADVSRQRAPEDPSGDHFTVVPLKEQAIGGVRKAVWLIAAAIAGVITIACLNVAHLLMVRLRERRHELAVRAALGAGRIAALRHAVFESVLLAAAGLVVALPLVTLMVRALHRFAPPDIPRLDAVMLGGELVPIVALATLGIGLCVGAVSTLDLRAGALHDVLRSQARGYSGSATWGRIVVAMEVAVSITVAVPAVLLLRSFLNVATTAPGFEIQRALTFQVRMPARYREYPEVVDVYDRVIRELQAVNGVTSAAYTWQLPMGQTLGATSFSSETGKRGMALIHRVSPGFFQAMGMRVTRGAGLASQSDLPAVVVNETFAGVHWGDVDPIGAVMTVDGIRSRITGIVNDIRQTSLEQPPAPEMYRAAVLRSMYVVVRTEGAAGTFRSVIRDAIARVDPSIPVSDIRTLEERLARTMARRRSIATGVVAFGITAALLALIGLYGVTAVVVAGRRREIAIRMALGSTAGAVITMFIRWMLPAIAAGLMIGGMAAWILGRQMQSMLFGIQSGDPWTYAVTAVVLAAATLIATYVPARRAGRTSPAEVFGS